MTRRILPALFLLLATTSLQAAKTPTTRQWTIDDVAREAIIYAPASAKTEPTPLVFAFHGHGGKMQDFAKKFPIHSAWPEAIVVYPQGLNTPGRLTDHEGKFPGWQAAPGEQSDRDLKFFDQMLADLEKDYKVDPARIYCTGHSNGGTFTYVLWQARGEEFAAFAPIASALRMVIVDIEAPGAKYPNVALRPVLHVAGQNDPLVKFEWQEKTIEALRKINHCTEGQPWGDDTRCTLYPSPDGAPVISLIHAGKHNTPSGAPEIITKFFKQFPTAAASSTSEKARGGRTSEFRAR